MRNCKWRLTQCLKIIKNVSYIKKTNIFLLIFGAKIQTKLVKIVTRFARNVKMIFFELLSNTRTRFARMV